MNRLLLSPNEARVLAALIEKSITTPQYYPLTVNGAMLAANQKNARSPVMNLNEGDVGAALNQLEAEKLATRDDLAGRVPKWRHRFHHQLLLKPHTMALLATLMLRGPQTAAELRSNAQGLGGPADAEGISAALADLSDRAQPLIALLPRMPGQAAPRYAHLLSGEPAVPAADEAEAPRASARGGAQLADLEARIAELEARVAELERLLPAA
ncbi:MAG: YceH family protein [Nevskia sp.]|jgi:hypothetical protein|nr:YceH family protein [Nevskia sp.]